MYEMKRSLYCFTLLGCLLFLGGCSEANFKLSEDSRLPKWFQVPSNVQRNNFSVTMDYYVTSEGREAVFKLFDKNGRRIEKVTGRLKGLAPIKTIETHGDRPIFEVITVNAETEVIVHKSKNNIFHIVESPRIIEEVMQSIEAISSPSSKRFKGTPTVKNGANKIRRWPE